MHTCVSLVNLNSKISIRFIGISECGFNHVMTYIPVCLKYTPLYGRPEKKSKESQLHLAKFLPYIFLDKTKRILEHLRVLKAVSAQRTFRKEK